MKLNEFKDRIQINKKELLEIVETLKNDYKINIGVYFSNLEEDKKLILRIKYYTFLYESINELWNDLKEIVKTTTEHEEALQHKQFLLRNEINQSLELIEKKYNQYEISIKVKQND